MKLLGSVVCVGAAAPRGSDRRHRVGRRTGVLRATREAGVGAAAVALRSRMDGAVSDDGDRRAPGLAQRSLAADARRALLLRGPSARERGVELVVLPLAPRRRLVRRHRRALADDRRDHRLVRAFPAIRGAAPHAVPCLGDVRGRAERDTMAAESGTGLVRGISTRRVHSQLLFRARDQRRKMNTVEKRTYDTGL